MTQKFDDLPEHTKKFLRELREEEVQELTEAIEGLRTMRRVGKFGKWVFGSIVLGFASVVLLGESIAAIWKWVMRIKG